MSPIVALLALLNIAVISLTTVNGLAHRNICSGPSNPSCMLTLGTGAGEKIRLRTAKPERTEVGRYQKFELTLNLTTAAANPFDPDEIDVHAVFTSPQGKSVTVPAFLYQPFMRRLENGMERLDPAGEPVWKVRFAADSIGTWSYRVTAKDETGTVSLPQAHFRVIAGDSQGFVRRSAHTPTLFAYDNGRPYFPVGENMCWAGEAGTFDFDRWLADLREAGGDWIRLWMTEDKLAIEWSGGKTSTADYIGYHGLSVYSLDNAWKLDTLLDTAARDHIDVMICLGTYGEFTTGGYFNEGAWPRNPYNAANGGPCKTPEEFWTNPTARAFYRRRLRYLMARYGWRTNIFAWEFWNEANPPASWVGEMARYLKGTGEFAGHPADPYHHLVSTTYGNDAIWKLPEVDFTMSHNYGEGDIADFAPVVHSDAQANAAYGKPHLMAEFGIDWRAPDRKYDPEGLGIDLHNGMWAAVTSGDAGTAMLWWWDNYIAPLRLYAPFRAVRNFTDTVPWNEGEWKPLQFDPPHTISGPETFTDMHVSATLGWGKAASAEFTLTPQGKVSGGMIPAFLYSPGKADLRTTPAFHVHFTRPGRFLIHVHQVSASAHLRFLLDGKPAAQFDFNAAPPADKASQTVYIKTEFEPQYNIYLATYDKDYGIEVPAGEHMIVLEVTEGDWLSLDRLTLTGYRSSRYPDVNLYGIQNGKRVLLWAQNAVHNWKNAYEHKPMPPIPATELTLHGLADGRYTLFWWDTAKGIVVRREALVVQEGRTTLHLPPISEDIAAQMSMGNPP